MSSPLSTGRRSWRASASSAILDYDASYLTAWAGLFVRREPTLREVITEYERSEWQFRNENRVLRQELTKVHAMTGDQVVSEHLPEVQQRLEDTLARLADAERDVRVARDAAVGAEAARGALLAKLHETTVALHAAYAHQQQWEAVLEADPRSQQEDPISLRNELNVATKELADLKGSTTWKMAWKLLAPYRRLRR